MSGLLLSPFISQVARRSLTPLSSPATVEVTPPQQVDHPGLSQQQQEGGGVESRQDSEDSKLPGEKVKQAQSLHP